VSFTPPHVQNGAVKSLSRAKPTAQTIIKSPRQIILSKHSLFESKFDERYNSDGDKCPWCDVFAIEGEQDHEEDEIPEIQIEGISKKQDVNASKSYPINTDTVEKENGHNPSLPVDDDMFIEQLITKKMKIPELKNELKREASPS